MLTAFLKPSSYTKAFIYSSSEFTLIRAVLRFVVQKPWKEYVLEVQTENIIYSYFVLCILR